MGHHSSKNRQRWKKEREAEYARQLQEELVAAEEMRLRSAELMRRQELGIPVSELTAAIWEQQLQKDLALYRQMLVEQLRLDAEAADHEGTDGPESAGPRL